jgi:hypothetical protein
MFKQVIVGVDGNDGSRDAIALARRPRLGEMNSHRGLG